MVCTEIASGRIEITEIEDGRRNKYHVLILGQLVLKLSPWVERIEKPIIDSTWTCKSNHATVTD